MSKASVAAHAAAAERAAAARIIVDEFAQSWPEWRIWLAREGRSIVATRRGPQQPPDDERWAKTVIGDDLDELQAQLVEQRKLFSVAVRM